MDQSTINVSSSTPTDGVAPRLLFLNQNSRGYGRKRTLAERKIINTHVQHMNYRKRREISIKRLRQGRREPLALPLRLNRFSAAKQTPAYSQADSELGNDAVHNKDHDTKFHEDVLNEDAHLLSSYPSGVFASSISSGDGSKLGKVPMMDNAAIDPFATSAVHITPRMNLILSHYLKGILPLVFPIPLQVHNASFQILQLIMAYPVLMSSTLAVSSVHQTSPSSPRPALPASPDSARNDYLIYKGSAISQINAGIAKPDFACSAATIFSITQLMTIETMIGSTSDVSTHIAGIEKILKLRKGLHGLPIIVIELLLPCLYLSSVWANSKPLFAPPKSQTTLSPFTVALLERSRPPELVPLCTSLLSPPVSSFFSPILFSTIRAILNFTLFREYFTMHPTSRHLLLPELNHITLLGLHIEYKLLSLPFTTRSFQHDPIQECVRNALLMFKNSLYGIHSPNAAIYRAFLLRMKTALHESDLERFWDPAGELLLWVLCIGAHHSEDDEWPWFLGQITRGMWLLDIRDWEGFQWLLRRFAYLDRLYESSIRRIWQEVQKKLVVWKGTPGEDPSPLPNTSSFPK